MKDVLDRLQHLKKRGKSSNEKRSWSRRRPKAGNRGMYCTVCTVIKYVETGKFKKTQKNLTLIFKELKNLKAQKKRIYICGGGIHNTFLINRLEEIIENNIFSTSLLGIDPDFLEASCFAWLAHQRLDRKKFDLSKVTGSQGRVLLGEVWEVS